MRHSKITKKRANAVVKYTVKIKTKHKDLQTLICYEPSYHELEQRLKGMYKRADISIDRVGEPTLTGKRKPAGIRLKKDRKKYDR